MQNPADLIILDYDMPDFDGMQTFEKIKSSERERKAMAGVTKLARERSKKANLHNSKLRDCRIHFSDVKNDRKEESSIFIT